MWPGVNKVFDKEYQKDDVVYLVKWNSDEIIGIGAMATNFS